MFHSFFFFYNFLIFSLQVLSVETGDVVRELIGHTMGELVILSALFSVRLFRLTALRLL